MLLAHLGDVSLRSAALALIACPLLIALRPRAGAAMRHAVWTIILAGMLLLFALAPVLPAIPLRILEAATVRISPAALPAAWSAILPLLYGSVALVCLLRVLVGALLISRILRAGTPAPEAGPGVFESAVIAVPLTAGWIRPRILLPPAWRTWDKSKLEAVLAHEASHVRRRDSLLALLAAVNRSLLWFHPLAWWVERRLSLLAEQICDDHCLRVLGDRRRYAQLLLDMAGAVEAVHGRVLRHVALMARPSHIRQRVDAILDGTRRPSRELPSAAWAAIFACALPLIWGAGALRLEPAAPRLVLPFPAPGAPAASPVLAFENRGPVRVQPRRRNPGEYQIASAVQKETDPRHRLDLLNSWRRRYPHTEFEVERLQLYLNTYSQLNDVPNLLTALNQMGKESFVKALKINPDLAETDFSPADLPATTTAQSKVSKALFFYARAATYEGPGSLAVEDRRQLDEFLRKAYSSYYGQNAIGLNELKNLAKSAPFPPQAFLISLLPPPDRSFDATLAAATSSVHIRNKCPYGLRIDCSGPDRRHTWIPAGEDSQLVLTPGTYQIYAADARGVSSFTGPGRFDPQFDYAYALKRD
jgi:beta-lactamase regulating signal transducer with metallopeptidase domain